MTHGLVITVLLSVGHLTGWLASTSTTFPPPLYHNSAITMHCTQQPWLHWHFIHKHTGCWQTVGNFVQAYTSPHCNTFSTSRCVSASLQSVHLVMKNTTGYKVISQVFALLILENVLIVFFMFEYF